ncbi:MAG TPA: UDP-glucose 4-epimerase GalE [Candidatus Udaeobacter sp.]|jgi:UDP-glucose 4-epimerase|nr:UDP-glucose 4-epimerase GalE [Candidatus Udaeobacter sp.]
MKILVTGGAGYIGSAAVELLIAAGESVIVFDNLSLGHRAAVHPAAVFVKGDLSNRAEIDGALSDHRPDAVMHFAAKSLVGESMEKPFLYLGDNVRNGLNLLESMVEHGVKRIILSSTANLFAQPERMPIDESERIVPGSPYGESKFILERMLHWLDRIYGLRFACLRYFNAAGATPARGEDHDPELHLIPLVLQVALGKREKVTIFGEDYPTRDGTCVRDYIHVIDLAQAHILALRALDRGSSFYNLGNGEGFTVKEVIDTAREITGRAIRADIGPRRAGDPAVLVAASDKIRKELGWVSQFPRVHEIIESAWRWHKANPNGYTD